MTVTAQDRAPATVSSAGRPAVRRPHALFRLDGSISRGKYTALALASFAAILGIWWAVTAITRIDPLFLPSPLDVGKALLGQVENGELASDAGVSLARIGVAFVIAAVMALPVGVAASRIRFAGAITIPVLEFVRYMPLVAFIPLTIIWAGTSEVQKIIVLWIGTFFSLALMVVDDVARVPKEFVEVGKTFGMRDRRILSVIVLRAAMPGIWDSLRLALGWCWSYVVFAELIASTSGLGYRITIAQRYSEVDVIFGYIIVLGLLGLATDQLMRAAHRLFFRYVHLGRS